MTIEMMREIINEVCGNNAQYVEKMMSDEIRRGLTYGKKFDEEHPEFAVKSFKEKAERYNTHLTPANAKVGDGATICLWSDRNACTIVKVTKKTITVRQDKATLDPNFKPEWIAGGFAGHCTNQNEQKYTYEPNENGAVTTFHWSERYQSFGTPGNPRLIAGRHEYYDYNF